VKGDRLYLTHILDAIEKIETYISVGHDVFVSTSHWQDAVIRQLPYSHWVWVGPRQDIDLGKERCKIGAI